ncbi:fibronectin type III domain-containing protein [Oleiharenicola lentus]|uniref:fibronectin type III domain-containing protein n=1 Tax=Oleiharenicola lentus TaxID=2508720 RepID=UPI003F66E227
MFLRGIFAVCVFGTSWLASNAATASKLTLTATLVSPIDIKLAWTNPDPQAAGHVVEYDTDPKGEFVILEFCPAGQSEYLHPRLVPQTKFYYRVRPYYGPATDPVKVVIAEGISDEAYAKAYELGEDYSWAAPQKNPDDAGGAKESIKGAARSQEASPTALKATVIKTTISGFKLTWNDRSSDETGFMLERKRAHETGFSVCAITEADITSFGWAFEPPERMAEFRIRAYHFGAPTAIVSQQSQGEPEPEDAPAPAKTNS